MATAAEPEVTDAAELQNVLTRYSDSYFGYLQAAEVVQCESLATAFVEIAARRKEIVKRVASMIAAQGEKPDTKGSPEGVIHRWWICVRAGMSEEEFRATLEECVRGETELARTVSEALEVGALLPDHAELLAQVKVELEEALRTFRIALGRC